MDLTTILQTCMKGTVFGNPNFGHTVLGHINDKRKMNCLRGMLTSLSWLHENQYDNLKHKYLEPGKRNLSFFFSPLNTASDFGFSVSLKKYIKYLLLEQRNQSNLSHLSLQTTEYFFPELRLCCLQKNGQRTLTMRYLFT